MDKPYENSYEKMREFIFMRGKESKILEKLMEKKTIEFMNHFDENGNTALHYAVSQNYSKVIEIYFEYAKDRNLWKNDKSVSLEAIRFSIKVWVNFENSDGMTALHYASLKGSIMIAQMLENEGAKADKITKTGLTMLHIAVQENRLASLIHFRGKVDLNATDNNQSTVLHWAVYKGYERIVEYILSENKFQLTFRDINGQTALHIAALYNRSKMVEILLKNGAKRMVKDKENKYPVELTESKEIVDTIEVKKKWCKSEYVHKKKERDSFYLEKLIVIIGVLAVISFFNYNRNLPINGFFWYFIENGVLFCGMVLLLFLSYKKNKIQKMDISELKTCPEIIEFYCFNCRVGPKLNENNLYEKDVYEHCDICNECFDRPFKHSLICNRCICRSDVEIYVMSITAFAFFCALQFIHEVILTECLINRLLRVVTWRIILVIANLFPLVLLVFCVRELYRVILFVSKKKKSKNILSESYLNLNSTLLAEKLGENAKISKETADSNNQITSIYF